MVMSDNGHGPGTVVVTMHNPCVFMGWGEADNGCYVNFMDNGYQAGRQPRHRQGKGILWDIQAIRPPAHQQIVGLLLRIV